MISSRVPGLYPAVGSNPIADRIRQRRGHRGITPLDSILLHAPHLADGMNTLAGAVRTGGNLPADVREAIILRVAAHNHAKYEWVHHEHLARQAGLTAAHLSLVRDTSAPIPPHALTSLQAAALAFADASTKDIHVSDQIFTALACELALIVSGTDDEKEEKVYALLVECGIVVAFYNTVSRFLLAFDVAGMANDPVPDPADPVIQGFVLPFFGARISLVTQLYSQYHAS